MASVQTGKPGPGACFRVLKSLGRARLSGMTGGEKQNDADFPAIQRLYRSCDVGGIDGLRRE